MTTTGAFIALAAVAVGLAILWPVFRRRPSGRDRRPPYLVALGALIDGDRELAFTALKEAARADSGNIDAYLRLGDLFRERGDAERALQLHRELTTRGGLDARERARIHESLARDWMSLGRPERAADAVGEAVKHAPDPAGALALQLEIQESREHPDDAFRAKRDVLKHSGRAKEGTSELADYRAEQAVPLIESGELAAAEKLLKEAQKLDETAARTGYLWGLLKEKQGDYPAALRTWEEILASHPEKVVLLFRSLERVHFLNGTYGDMESTYQRFLERMPSHEDASFGLARFLLRKGQLKAALDACRAGLDQSPDSQSLRILRLQLLLQIGNTPDAETMLNDWISELLGEGPDPSSIEQSMANPGGSL